MPPQFLRATIALLFVFGVLIVLPVSDSRSQTSWPQTRTGKKSKEHIRALLENPVSFEFVDTSLIDVAKLVESKIGVPVRFDIDQLEVIGVTPKDRVSANLKNVPFGDALSFAFLSNELECTYVVSDSFISITSIEDAAEKFSIGKYVIDDSKIDTELLTYLLKIHIDPMSWRDNGGEGSIAPSGNNRSTLFVTQNEFIHRRCWRFVQQLKLAIHGKEQKNDQGETSRERILAKLEQPISVDFVDTPIAEVAQYIETKLDIPTRIDDYGFDQVGVTAEHTLSAKFEKIPACDVLTFILNEHDCDWYSNSTSIVFTSNKSASSHNSVEIFDITKIGADPIVVCDLMIVHCAPDTWECQGGSGVITPFVVDDKAILIVSQTEPVHRDCRLLISMLQNMALNEVGHVQFEAFEKAHKQIRKKLAMPISVDFVDTPLDEIARSIESKIGVPVRLNPLSLDLVGVGPDDRCALTLKNVPAEEVINLLLDPLELTYSLKSSFIEIVSIEDAQQRLTLELHDITDLSADKYFVERLTDVVNPDTWENYGGIATATVVNINKRSILVVSQVEAIHKKISNVLQRIRSLTTDRSEKTNRPKTGQERICEILNQPISLEFAHQPLAKIAKAIESKIDVPIILNKRGLDYNGVTAETEFTISVDNVPVSAALEFLLIQYECTFIVKDSTIALTSKENAEEAEQQAIEMFDLTEMAIDAVTFAELLVCHIDADTWEWNGGTGTITAVNVDKRTILIVAQTHATIRKCGQFVERVRQLSSPIRTNNKQIEISGRNRIRTELNRPISFNFEDASLSEVTRFFESKIDIEIEIDIPELELVRITPDDTLTVSLTNVPANEALDLLVKQLDCAYYLTDSMVVITSKERSIENMTAEIYDITDLGVSRFFADSITDIIDTNSWEVRGGMGCAQIFRVKSRKVLLVTQSTSVHKKIRAFIEQIRLLMQNRRSKDKPIRTKAELIRANLNKPISFRFDNTPLVEVAKFVEAKLAFRLGLMLASSTRLVYRCQTKSRSPSGVRQRRKHLIICLIKLIAPLSFPIRSC